MTTTCQQASHTCEGEVRGWKITRPGATRGKTVFLCQRHGQPLAVLVAGPRPRATVVATPLVKP